MTRPLDDIMQHEDGGCVLTVDNRYYPLLFCDINGAFTLASVDFYFRQWRKPLTDYAEQQGEVVVTIVTLSSLAAPPATVRKAAGQWIANDATTKGLYGTIIVVNNPVLRGVFTAMVWVAGRENTLVEYTSSLENAINMAIKHLETHGTRPPTIDPKEYTPPVAKRNG